MSDPGSARPSYAGLATRTLAFAIDAAVINVVAWFVGAVFALALSLLSLPKEVLTVLTAVAAFVALLWTFSYFVFFWSGNGQTPGNRLIGITVLDATSLTPLRARRAAFRFVLLPLSALLLFAGFLMILFDGRRRALHDRLARSVVIYVPVARPRRAGAYSAPEAVARA